MEARVPVAPGFDENCTSMTHDFSQVPKEFGPGLVDCNPQSNFNLFEMQIKPELRCAIEDSGEDVDMDYMMEMSFECDNGSDAVTDEEYTTKFEFRQVLPDNPLVMDCMVTADEQERRRIRRERNKVAASKCRKKRKEHVKTLVETSEELEHQNNDLQGQISKLQAEIKQLEFMLDSHSCAKYSHSQQDDNELGLNVN